MPMNKGQKRRRSIVKIKEDKMLKDLEKQDEKVRMAKLLVRKLDITNIQVLLAYDKFFKKHPQGTICKEEFLNESKGNLIAETLFNVFDEDNSGSLDFYEFMMVKNTSNLQTPEQKLNWIFTAFDRDGSGSIDSDEITAIVLGLLKIASKSIDADEVAICVKEVREAIDNDDDGNISKEEFIENAMKGSFINNIVNEKSNI